MSTSHTTAATAVSDGRLYMPPIETITPADVRIELSNNRKDGWKPAFGLENDTEHWLRMKEYGRQLCQEELPPKKLSDETKENLGLTREECKKLEYVGAQQITKHYVWDYLTVPWRKRFDYDMQYLQKRHPDIPAKDIICSLFSQWNSEDNLKSVVRKHAEGRDISQLYHELKSKEKADHRDPTELSAPLVEPHDQDELSIVSLTDSNATINPTSHFSMHRSRYVPGKHVNEVAGRTGGVDWESVMLDIQYRDPTGAILEPIPLLFICRSMACMPGNIRMAIVKTELQKQGVSTADFFLRLNGFPEDFSWDLKDLCMALTIWHRNRLDNELDVPLLLIPRSSLDVDVDMNREETAVANQNDAFVMTTGRLAHKSEPRATRPTRDNHATYSHKQSRNAGIGPISANDQDPRRAKRKRDDALFTLRSDNESLQKTRLESMDAHEDDGELTDTHSNVRNIRPLRRGRSMARRRWIGHE